MGQRLVAGVETGGTKLLARICEFETGSVVSEGQWATTTPEEAAENLTDALTSIPAGSKLVAAAIAAFGPVTIDPASPEYGKVLPTPKPGWTGSNLRSLLQQRLGIPVAVDSDVNAAAVAEQAIGAGRGLPTVAYVTVGTGIGAGLAIEGQSLKGALHPEAGHLPIIREPDDAVPSSCPFHSNCAEGLCAGPAIRERLGVGRDLADDLALVERVSNYLGQLGGSLVLAWSPHRIIWGGGIIRAAPMMPMIQEKLRAALAGYGVGPFVEGSEFCAEAELQDAGLEGALIMARRLVIQSQ